MSSGEVRRVSRQDIQLVQNLIERCLQLYMNQKEVMETLLLQARIEPGFTELVWKRLEQENREFFEAYHVRLMVKHQIMTFNKLLAKQTELMQMYPTGVAPLPVSNGSLSSSLSQAPLHYDAERTVPLSRPDIMHRPIGPSGMLTNGGPSAHGGMAAGNILAHNGSMNISPNMLPTQNSQMGMMQGMNGMVIKSEPHYSNGSPFSFGVGGNVLETHPTVRDVPVATFPSIEHNSEPLNEPLLDNDSTSFGYLAQIPRNFSNFSLSDLTADFSQNSDILENFCRSPFRATDTGNFLDPNGIDCQGENKRLDTVSEGSSFEDFGKD